MTPFHYEPTMPDGDGGDVSGAYVAMWGAYEIVVFAAMVRSVIEVIQVAPPDDATRRKLFPAASSDATAADEFSRLVGGQIEDKKLNTLMHFGLIIVSNLPESGDEFDIEVPVVIPEAKAPLALQALSAIRVYLGAKLKIEDDQDSEILYQQMLGAIDNSDGSANAAKASQDQFLANVFFASGFIQESLVEAMMAPYGDAAPSGTD